MIDIKNKISETKDAIKSLQDEVAKKQEEIVGIQVKIIAHKGALEMLESLEQADSEEQEADNE